jgi:hypothetical protein
VREAYDLLGGLARSYLFEGLRAPILFGWDGEALALGFGFAAAIAIAAIIGASHALRTRLVHG